VGQIFLEHYVPRWEDSPDAPTGWLAKVTSPMESRKEAAGQGTA
jgi:hypothetical protein